MSSLSRVQHSRPHLSSPTVASSFAIGRLKTWLRRQARRTQLFFARQANREDGYEGSLSYMKSIEGYPPIPVAIKCQTSAQDGVNTQKIKRRSGLKKPLQKHRCKTWQQFTGNLCYKFHVKRMADKRCDCIGIVYFFACSQQLCLPGGDVTAPCSPSTCKVKL